MNYLIDIPTDRITTRESGLLNLVNIGDKSTYVQRKLIKDGLSGYELETQAALYTLIDQHESDLVFYDVGAHIGLYTLLVSMIFTKKRITSFAFEPTPTTAEIALKLRGYNSQNFILIRKAISSDGGEIEFYLSPKAETSNSLNPNFRLGGDSIVVQRASLDQLISEGLPPPQVIKIDVESHEYQVLIGALKTISNYRPFLICEFLPQDTCNEIEKSMEFLKSINYKIYSITRNAPPKLIDIDSMLKYTNHSLRDWILAPHELSNTFTKEYVRWKKKIILCNKVFQVVKD